MKHGLKRAIEQKLNILVVMLIAIQPALDVLSYFLAERLGSNTISTALRFLLLAAVSLLGFVLSERKKIYFILYGVAGLFWILHAANCFRIGYTSPVADAGNFLRILNFPLFILSFITFFQRGKEIQKSIFTGFAINLGEIILFTALPWLSGHPVYTYNGLGLGVLGWFSTPSAQSAIIVLVVPLALYRAYQAKKYLVFLLAALGASVLMFLTGTKLTFYSIFIVMGAYCFLFAVNLKKHSLKYVLPLLLILILTAALRHQSPMAVREHMSDYAQGNYSGLVKSSIANSGVSQSAFSLLEGDFDPDQLTPEELELVRRLLIGVYTDPEVYGAVFEGLYDRFGVYNVMDAYDYTYEARILSDSRVRKSIFAKLVWEEKDFVTRLFGFEYSDMISDGEIYDLENDFPAVFYFCGYIGFALYMLIFLYFAFLILRAFVRDVADCSAERQGRPGNFIVRGLGSFWQGVSRYLTLEMGAVGMTFLLAVIAAQISGNVLRRPNVTVYFAAASACVYYLTVLRRKKDGSAKEEPLPEQSSF